MAINRPFLITKQSNSGQGPILPREHHLMNGIGNTPSGGLVSNDHGQSSSNSGGSWN